MPIRATKRGAERTPLSADCDVLVCGASFAGLTVARELAGSGAKILILDRYEIGERQTSACAAPTAWLENLGLEESIVQRFDELVIHRHKAMDWPVKQKTYRWALPWSFATFDYRRLCQLLAEQGDAEFETAKVDGRTGDVVHTDRGDLTAPLIVDALGWRRVLDPDSSVQPPKGRLSRGLEVHPAGAAEDLEIWLDPDYIRAGYSWSFPAGDEVRIGVGSFDPRDHVKEPTVRLTHELGNSPDGYQGNWIPHKLRQATDDRVFYVGDSAGHCLPTTAEGIRTAFYFGIACGRELRLVLDGHQTRGQALQRYDAFNEDHRWAFSWLLRVQSMVSVANKLTALDTVLDLIDRPSFVRWAFDHYLEIAPPSFALAG